ncbi:DUF1850 domain-containing protein [Paracoccus sp. Z118]|uniref:DUF1850 domain-containing protein n=1 Tax=Paracoccus sp. Z118 TaxID=2851017 RepID=UPI001C2C049A|nr:DUF1850 domain-containing protein [Paracoccus sp. Z118]MBV0892057.1 DUF1850 domain-containing protein [Paracoccus sp. Z118]
MSGCLMAGAIALAVSQGFTLGWTHSVERVGWVEEWQIDDGRLHLTQAAVRGSGAGMEPGEGAVLKDGWWVWSPGISVPSLSLAASGATGQGWRLCTDSGCRIIGAEPGAPLLLTPCAKGVAGE